MLIRIRADEMEGLYVEKAGLRNDENGKELLSKKWKKMNVQKQNTM